MRLGNDEFFIEEVRKALIADERFDFQRSGEALQNGICPLCGERRCFVSLKKPFQVMCNRRDSCGYMESTRKIYSHLFDDLAIRFPRTETNQNAPADAYMQYNRGFDLSKIKGMYDYYDYFLDGANRPTVRVRIDNGSYWHRFINGSDANAFGKNRNSGAINASGWSPPGMKVKENDEIWITEAIFKSIALLHIGKKSVSGLSTSGFYRDFVERHKGKNIRWIMAMDNGTAGIEAAKKFVREIRAMNETVFCAFPAFGEDWDDVFRAGRLDEVYIEDSFWRGKELLSSTLKEKAFWNWAKTRKNYEVFDFRHALYRVVSNYSDFPAGNEEDGKKDEKISLPHKDFGWNLPHDLFTKVFNKFCSFTTVTEICNMSVHHTYIEEDLMHNVTNFFHVKGDDKDGNKLVSGDGNVWTSVKQFNSCLAKQGTVVFRGTDGDLDYLRRRWISGKVIRVRGVPFLGYDREKNIYVFKEFAYKKGRFEKMNEHGFVRFDKESVKCNLNDPYPMEKKPDPFDGSWIEDYKKYLGMNGLIILSWWIGTLFAEQIRAKSGHWPFLEVTGTAGTGKSTAVKFLWKCLGVTKEQGFDPNKTSLAGLAREIAKCANLPAVLMESDREQDSRSRKKQFDFNYFKPQFEGGVLRTVGISGGKNDTETLHFRGGLLVMQNQQIMADEPGYQRIVWCPYEERVFSRESIRAVDRLNEMTTKQLGGFLHEVLRKEDFLLSGFFRIYEEIYQDYTQREEKENLCPSLRIRRTHAQVAAWSRLLPEIFGRYFTAADAENLVNELWERAKKQYARGKDDSPILERFWQAFEYLHTLTDETGKFIFLNHSKNPDLLAINMPELHRVAALYHVELPPEEDLFFQFRESKTYKFVNYKNVSSALRNNTTLKCWVFKIPR